MQSNPYESPRAYVGAHRQIRSPSLLAYAIAWSVLFLLPAFSVMCVNYFPVPDAMKLAPPESDGIVARLSLQLGIPGNIVFSASLIGCTIVALVSPLAPEKRILIVIV